MNRLKLWIPVQLIAICLFAGAVCAGLRESVETVIRRTDLGGATVAVSIIEAGPGDSLVEINADQLMIPASNMKLLTTGAALHTLGPDFRFQTKLLLNNDDLIVVADGDPAFGDPILLERMAPAIGTTLDVEGFLRLWTDRIVEAGITRIDELIIDDRVFDREFVHPTWPRDQLNRRYCAQVSGLTFHLNILHFYPAPRTGRPALDIFQPMAGWIDLRNRATGRTGVHDKNDIWIARELGTNNLTFYGNVKHPYVAPVPVTLHDVPGFFAKLFADRLRAAGIDVASSRLRTPDEQSSTGQLIGPVIYTPIDTAVTRCNQDSQNLYAECLLKRMGHAATGQPGSWLTGASIVRLVLHDRISESSLSSSAVIADGSGLSRDNRVAPATLSAWLNTFHNDEQLGAAFVDSLAVGGESGTLKRRLASDSLDGATVQAKSGYINGVSCLSGYVTSPSGARRCFSIMVNGMTSPASRAKTMQNEIVIAVAKDMAAEPVRLGSE